jgi:PTH1 family peptidyl-tRNA hydrolase
MRGSDGGHQGVRSVLTAFRTDALRRVRIGVGRSRQKDQLGGYVLSAFSPTDLPVIERTCIETVDRVLELLGDTAKEKTP